MGIRERGAATLVAVAMAAAGCGTEDCPYGSSSRTGDASVACDSRPDATAAETKAAIDGSALRAGMRAFAASGEAGTTLVGIGVNAWGETSFRRSEQDDDAITFGPDGRERPATGAFRREYALGSGSARVDPADIEPAELTRSVRRVLRASPGWRFERAIYGALGVAPGVGWNIDFARPERGGRVVVVGGGACVLTAAAGLAGAPPCDLQALLTGRTGQARGPAPSAPGPGAGEASDLAACVEAAGTDALALAGCAGG